MPQNSKSQLMITFAHKPLFVEVRVEGRLCGHILPVEGGYRYFPLRQKVGGGLFAKLEDCKRSLLGD